MNDWLRFRATVSGSVPVRPTTVSARTLGDAIEAVLLLYTRRDLEVVLRDELQLTWTHADSSPADEETKRDVIRRYTAGWGMPELVSLARRIRSELDVASEPLEPLLDAYERSGGVRSSAKNVIFAANGPKPDLVLRDALSNDIEIVRNGEYCLVYDRTLPADGLRYRHLVEWWRARESLPDTTTDQEVASALHRRLRDSLGDNGAELKVFDAYGRRYRDGGSKSTYSSRRSTSTSIPCSGGPGSREDKGQDRWRDSGWTSSSFSATGGGWSSRWTASSTTQPTAARRAPLGTARWSPRTGDYAWPVTRSTASAAPN